MSKKYFQNQNGLTLLEVLLSITILGIVLISFLSFFNQAYSYTKKNEDKTVGINVARNVLYYFEQQDYSHIKKAYLNDPIKEEQEISIANCDDVLPDTSQYVFDYPNVCESFFTTKVNNEDYESSVIFTRDIKDSENPDAVKPNLQDQLIGVEVKVEWNDQSASVRGLIKK